MISVPVRIEFIAELYQLITEQLPAFIPTRSLLIDSIRNNINTIKLSATVLIVVLPITKVLRATFIQEWFCCE